MIKKNGKIHYQDSTGMTHLLVRRSRAGGVEYFSTLNHTQLYGGTTKAVFYIN